MARERETTCKKLAELSSDWDWDLGPGTWDLGLGTWDLGPGTWDLGPGNRIENRE